MTPTLNVNLRPCTCPVGWPSGGDHWPGAGQPKCDAQPVLISCPLPRTVEMTVRLGECDCGAVDANKRSAREASLFGMACLPGCPARPIRVTCSIGGETWEGSEVSEVDWQTRNERGDWNPSPMSHRERDAVFGVCRDLWGAVKGLVLGQRAFMTSDVVRALGAQRNTEFAALTKLVQAEQAAIAAQAECDAAFPIDNYVKVPAPDHRSEPRPSTVRLAAFAAHLIASVGTL